MEKKFIYALFKPEIFINSLIYGEKGYKSLMSKFIGIFYKFFSDQY